MGDNQNSRATTNSRSATIAKLWFGVLGGTQNLVTDKQVRRLFALGKVETNLETAGG
jgi:hypothetical protein